MIILCCGDRYWKDQSFIRTVLITYMSHNPDHDLVIEGDCRGADRMAGAAARSLRMQISVYPAKWRVNGVYNPNAGPERNRVMLDQKPNLVIAFHDNLNASVGTKDCVIEATYRSIPVHHYRHGGDGLTEIDGVGLLPF